MPFLMLFHRLLWAGIPGAIVGAVAFERIGVAGIALGVLLILDAQALVTLRTMRGREGSAHV